MSMNGKNQQRGRGDVISIAAVEEILKLYSAWLGYLLSLMQEDTLRVKAADITAALDRFTCTVTREGDEYVIRKEKGDEHDRDAEACR